MITESGIPRLTHPGPVAPIRRDVLTGCDQKTYRIELARGRSLQDSVVHALKALAIKAAGLSIKHAQFDFLSYYQIASSREAEQVAHYTTPLILSERCRLVGSSGTIGASATGGYAIHCHGLVVTRSGRVVGGHFLPDACIVARAGVAYITALPFMELTVGLDPEIKTPVLQPSYSRDRGHEHH